MSYQFPAFLQGLILWTVVLVFFMALFIPKFSNLANYNRTIQESSGRISEFEARLNRVQPVDKSRPYQSYVHAGKPGTESSNQIQSDLLDRIQARDVRLIDLIEIPNSSKLGELSALMYRLEVEGDLQSVLDVTKTLGETAYPILIDRLELRPIETNGRPDRSIRLSANLTIWMGGV